MSTNVVQKATGASPTGLTDSLIIDNGTLVGISGAVGIGTNSPGDPLHVIKSTSTTNSFVVALRFTGASTGDATDGFGPLIGFRISDTGVSESTLGSMGFVRDGADTSGKFIVRTSNAGAGSTNLAVDHLGNVGTGTSSPEAKLHVIKTSEQLRVGYDTSNYLKLAVGATGLTNLNFVGTGNGVQVSDGTAPVSAAGSSDTTPADFAVLLSQPGVTPGRTFARSLILTETNDPVDLRIRRASTRRAITSLTRSGSTATATTSGDHNLTSGIKLGVSGANQSEYNVVETITVTGSTTFTYPVAGTPATPATTTDGLFMGAEGGSHAPFAEDAAAGDTPGKIHFDTLVSYEDATFKEFALITGKVRETYSNGGTMPPPTGGSHSGELTVQAYPEWFDDSLTRMRIIGDGTIAIGGGGYDSEGLSPRTRATLDVAGGGVYVSRVGTVPVPTLANGGSSGSTSYTFRLVAVDAHGTRSLPSAPATIANGPASLNATDFIKISWEQVRGAEYYYILKDTNDVLVSGSDEGQSCAVPGGATAIIGGDPDRSAIRINGATKEFRHLGWGSTGYTPNSPLRDQTGDMTVEGRLLVGDGGVGSTGEQPSYSFANASTSGLWYDSGTTEVRVSVGGGARVRVGTNTAHLNVDMVPQIDNTYNLGTGSLRWSLVRGVTITSGDLRFENDMVLTEHYNLGQGLPRGIGILDDRDPAAPTLAAFIAADGTIYAKELRSLASLSGTVEVATAPARRARTLEEIEAFNGRAIAPTDPAAEGSADPAAEGSA